MGISHPFPAPYATADTACSEAPKYWSGASPDPAAAQLTALRASPPSSRTSKQMRPDAKAAATTPCASPASTWTSASPLEMPKLHDKSAGSRIRRTTPPDRHSHKNAHHDRRTIATTELAAAHHPPVRSFLR